VSQLATFTLDIRALQKDLLEMGQQAPLIMARALNRAAVSGQTAMVKAVSADTGIAAKNVSARSGSTRPIGRARWWRSRSRADGSR